MSELETQLLGLLQDQQKDLEEQLASLSGQLKIFQTMLSDSLGQLEAYNKDQENILGRILVLEKKLKISTPPAESQEDEGEESHAISSEIQKIEGMERVADRIREIICLDSDEQRSKELMDLPSSSDFIITYENVMDLGWVDMQGKLTEKGVEERERLLMNNKEYQLEIPKGASVVKGRTHSDSDVNKVPSC